MYQNNIVVIPSKKKGEDGLILPLGDRPTPEGDGVRPAHQTVNVEVASAPRTRR